MLTKLAVVPITMMPKLAVMLEFTMLELAMVPHHPMPHHAVPVPVPHHAMPHVMSSICKCSTCGTSS